MRPTVRAAAITPIDRSLCYCDRNSQDLQAHITGVRPHFSHQMTAAKRTFTSIVSARKPNGWRRPLLSAQPIFCARVTQNTEGNKTAQRIPPYYSLISLRATFVERNGRRPDGPTGGNFGVFQVSFRKKLPFNINWYAWWARQDSNLRPDRYERPALTN